MSQSATEIEVEVVEIDGVAQAAPQARADENRQARGWYDWNHWQGRVRKLDSRWWPLWVVLGLVALALVLTVGVVIGAVFLVLRVLRGMVRAVFGGPSRNPRN